jgi:hypothetical protein
MASNEIDRSLIRRIVYEQQGPNAPCQTLLLLSMARKKQSARVSTGGSGVRKPISTHARVPSKDAIMASPPTSPLAPESTRADKTLDVCAAYICVNIT